MKKTIALLLTFAVFFSFAACRKDDASAPATITTSTAAETISAETTSCHVTEEVTTTQSVTVKEKTTLFSKVITTVATTLRLTATTAKTNALNTTQAKVTTTAPITTIQETTTAEAKNICTISINCAQIIGNENKLKTNKSAFVPEGGEILKTVTVEFNEGETAFDILKRVCSECACNDNCRYCQDNGIQLEYEFTPGYNNYYVEGIHQIYEKDCGSKSGWMYKVNGAFPNYGCSSYTVESGDKIEFIYTLNLGEDIGAPVN